MKITHCQVNHMTNPLGFAMSAPRFTYRVEDAQGKHQTYARVEIFTEGMTPCYDTGLLETGDLTGIQTDLVLAPCTRYFWRVTVRTEAGEEAVSDLNWFETGKMDTPWVGKWLTHPRAKRMPVYTKAIPVSKPLQSARLYICGLGLYEAFLTREETTDSRELTADKKIGSEVLTPYSNNYNAWLQYQTYDITAQLRENRVLNIWMGQGWYLGRFGFYGMEDENSYYGKNFRLIADVVLTYEDGTTETVGTDESWRVWPSNLCHNNLYDGETLDDTQPQGEMTPAVVFDGEMAPLSDRYSPAVRVQEVIKPVALLTTPAGEQVFDLGQNLSGVFTLKIRPRKGDVIHIQVGEVLQNGNFYNENLRTARAEYWYTADGRETMLQPKFTYYGCRYIKVAGVRDLKKEDLEALVYYSDMEELGSITTGHDKVNRLISNAHWGLKGNFLDVPTDCPQRDERMGWTGDAQVFSATACLFRDTYAFYRKYLHDMATEQQALGGNIPIVVPSFGYIDTACVWGDAATIMPWNVYQFSGDKTILAEQYESMKAWVEYLHSYDGQDRKWGQAFHYGDWLALDHAKRDPSQALGGTDEDFIAYVYYGHSAGLVAQTAELLGYADDAARYRALKDEIYAYIRQEYFSPNGRCCVGTQTAAIIALQYGVTPNREVTIRQLEKAFSRNDNHLQTGFVGTPHLCNVLTDCGMERLAYDLLLYEGYPGWLYTVNLGATTMWERWNSMDPDGSVSSTGMNSFNHYSYGSIAQWMFQRMAGLQPLTPGFQRVRIAPVLDRRMGHVDMEYRSAAGTYRIAWKVENKQQVTLSVTVPFGCEAEMVLYGAQEQVLHLSAGSYTWNYEAKIPLGPTFSAENKLFELFDNAQAAQVLEKFGITAETVPGQHHHDSLQSLADTVESKVTSEIVERLNCLLREL